MDDTFMTPFLLTVNSAQVAMTDLLQFLDTRPEIVNWYAPYPWTVLVVGGDGQTAASLAALVRTGFAGAQFVISQVDKQSSDGWIPKPFWDLVQDPKSSGKWDVWRQAALDALKKSLPK